MKLNANKIGLLVAAFFAFGSTVIAAPIPTREVAFFGKVISKKPYALKFEAPAGHHFNLGAPAKVELSDGSTNAVGTLEKNEQQIKVDFQNVAQVSSQCEVKTSLYVCNNENTYCRPIKENFDCQNLRIKK